MNLNVENNHSSRTNTMKHRLNSFCSRIGIRLISLALVIAGTSLPLLSPAAGTWAPLVNTAPGGISLMLLLTDGTVMCQNSGNTAWYRLTPDLHGSYVNGTWTTLTPMNYSRRYYSSQILRSGQVFVAGGEYGDGGPYSEIYDPVENTWAVTPNAPGVDNFIDSISETLPDGNVLIAPVSPVSYGGTVIWNATNNDWLVGPTLYRGDDQDEAAWVKLSDQSILTIDPFGQNSERYIPSLNKWINNGTVPVTMYGYGGELGAGFLLPNGNAFYIGGTNHTAIYTPSGTTNAGVWTAGATIPNNLGAVDAPAAMMINGNVLCALGPDIGYDSPTYFYEYNYLSNSFTQVSAPGGGSSFNSVPYGCSLLCLPDGSVLFSGDGAQLFAYRPGGIPVTNGIPNILSATTNGDGSLHVTGTLFNGISEGAAYGDDEQMASDYPVARITNSSGNTLYCRTYNWSVYNPMTGTNLVSTEMELPAGLLAGTYPLVITANGSASVPYAITTIGTPLPIVTGLAFKTIASNQISFVWNAIGSTETGYVVERSTDGTNYSTVADLAANVTTYTDTAVSPLNQYYYQVLGTNAFGLGRSAPAIFIASPPVAALPAPWAAGDVGAVFGHGASGVTAGTYTVIGSGSGLGSTNDEFQFAYQPLAGDLSLTARVTAGQDTGSNALAGIVIRSGLENNVADVVMGFRSGSQNVQFQSRTNTGSPALVMNGPGGLTAPYWVRLVRSGNTFSGYASPDGNAWTLQGSVTVALNPTVLAGLAVTGGVTNLLNTSVFDNVTVTGATATLPLPLAEWKLDETSGIVALDSVGDFAGLYTNVTLGLPGATPDTGYSAGFNGTNANILIPPLNLNSNVLTITAWINPNGNQNAWSGIFFDREDSTANGLTFGTANELRYTWNNSAATYNWNSGLIPPPNQWSFVALVIQPTQAAIYMATNGILAGATNKVANSSQGFLGNSCIGQDTTSTTRYFNGSLDEVQFFNYALTPAQLNALASPPVITLATPVNGQEFMAPANISLAATISGANGHTINSVQFFEGENLVGQSISPPYTCTVTNLAIGTYAFSARMQYDSGLVVNSDPANVIVETAPAAPQNVAANALAGDLIYVAWSPVAGADGYVLNRNGTPIADFSTTNFYVDNGLQPGVDYCYTVTATNQIGSSTSASSCVTTPASEALTWDAGGTNNGPQDGNGIWNTSGTTWWNGSSVSAWANGSLAIFGSGTTTNCYVGISGSVSPDGFIFNQNNGGFYTLTNAGSGITLSGQTVVLADANVNFDVGLSGSGRLIKAGAGTLTLEVANSDTGGLTVNAGIVIASVPNGTAYGATGPGNLLVNNGGIAQANGDNSLVGQTTSASRTITINAGGIVTNTGTSSCHLNAVVLNGGTLAANSVNGTYGNWNFDHGISTSGEGTISTIAGGNATVSQTAGTIFNILAGDTVIVSTVLAHTSDGSDIGLVKSGAGTLVLQAANSYTSATTGNRGILQVDGSLATGAVTIADTATLAGNGTLNGATTIQNGGILSPGDQGIGALAFNNNLTLNAGSQTLLEISKNGGALENDLVSVAGKLTAGGTLVVTNIGNSTLAAGDSFALFNVGTFSGNFNSLSLPVLATNLMWDISKLATNGSIAVYALAQPSISIVNLAANGSFNLTGAGAPGQTYTLLMTTNLAAPVVWTPVATNNADSNGDFNFSDPQAANSSQRFYRVQNP